MAGRQHLAEVEYANRKHRTKRAQRPVCGSDAFLNFMKAIFPDEEQMPDATTL